MTRRARDGGFTLLEAVIAFAIAALALGALFEGAAAAMRLTSRSLLLEGAVSRAQSHFAEAGVLLGSEGERVEQGSDGSRYRWRVAIVPGRRAAVRRPGSAGDPAVVNAVRLYRIEVTERWSESGREHAFRLSGEHLFVARPGGSG